jgi:hypothetical protein
LQNRSDRACVKPATQHGLAKIVQDHSMGLNMRAGKISLLVAILSAVGTSNSFAQCRCGVDAGRHLSLSVFDYWGPWRVVNGIPDGQPVDLFSISRTRRTTWGDVTGVRNGEQGWVG